MQCYTELTPPTAVSHSVSLPFLSSKSTNLIIAKTSLLQIFNIKSVVAEIDVDSNHDVETSPHDIAAGTLDRTLFTTDIALQRVEPTAKLVLVGEYPLSGTVSSLGRVKDVDTKSGGEALLVAFRDAKISLVEWDLERHTISTVSIHYYESGLLQVPWAPDVADSPGYLTVDPSSRCAALRFGSRHVAILPFRQSGDDLAEDDFDADLDDPADRVQSEKRATNGELDEAKTPYSSSFILPLTALDPNLTFPVHLAFLFEYREPTFGILSSSRAPSHSLSVERRDILSYTVFTLDIDQRASTTLLSVSGLPVDLNTVVPLPLPVGGALLIGNNEFVHIDQAGKTTAVAVNEFAKQSSSFPMTDQSDLGLRLEGCLVEHFNEKGDMLIVLSSGELALLAFNLDGRSISGLHVHNISRENGGWIAPSGVSCISSLGRGRLFLGSEENDSIVVGWSRKTSQLTRKRSHADMLGEDVQVSEDEDDLEEDDDDIYGGGESKSEQNQSSVADARDPKDLVFRIHDRLPNFAPAGDITFGKPTSLRTNRKAVEKAQDIASGVQVVYPNGRGKLGGLVICRREIDPIVQQQIDLPHAQALWSIHPRKSNMKGINPDGQEDSEAQLSADADFDQYLIASLISDETEESSLYAITLNGIEKVSKGDFESEGATVDVGTIAGGTGIVQVMRSEVRCYDSEFGLEQILPMIDEATDVELNIISASFCDPYILLLRDDSSVMILETTRSGELEELERGDALLSSLWLSGCLFRSPTTNNKTMAFLLNAEGSLRIFDLSNLDKAQYSTDALPFLPSTITDDFVPRRYASRETLAEILVAEVGDAISKSTYLIIRNSLDDLIIYEPFHFPSSEAFTTNLRWIKVPQPKLARRSEIFSNDEGDLNRGALLKILDNVGGYSAVFQTGTSPNFVIKEASSGPRVINMQERTIRGIDTFHTAGCNRGFLSVDSEGTLRICQIPTSTRFGDTGWAMRKLHLEEEVQCVSYYQPKDLYVVSTCKRIEFRLPEDDYHTEWAAEETKFLPHINQGSIKLIYPPNWSVIDTLELDAGEQVLCMKAVNLEISESTHQRKAFIVAGSVIIKGEDLSARGNILVLDVIDVVPEPDRPETNRKLKVYASERVKGAVTALAEIGAQGFLLVTHGQKCMVRGLKEDQTLLPVAFLDMQCYVTVAKTLKGTGLVVMGDLAKGVWFTGYTEEPYRMMLFGKAASKMEVLAAEFMPYEKQLYIVVADADKNLHVLQYDPENPKSVSGRRLVQKSTFHTGHFPISLTIIPSTLQPPQPSNGVANSEHHEDEDDDSMDLDGSSSPKQQRGPLLEHILLTTQTGVLALLTPIDELTYLRLNALHTYLTSQLEHACGLNPRGYRAVEGERLVIKGVVDGKVLARWAELPSWRRAEACARVGVEESVVRADLEAFVGTGSVSYL